MNLYQIRSLDSVSANITKNYHRLESNTKSSVLEAASKKITEGLSSNKQFAEAGCKVGKVLQEVELLRLMDEL